MGITLRNLFLVFLKALVWTHSKEISYFQKSSDKDSVNKNNQDPMIPHNMKGQDLIRATDFNFLMVLGKGKIF